MGHLYKEIKKGSKYGDGWAFAVINNRPCEIFFKPVHGIYGHAYVKLEEYSKREQKMIDADIKKYRFTYRNRYYYDQKRLTKQKAPTEEMVFPKSERGKPMSLESFLKSLKTYAKKKKSKKT